MDFFKNYTLICESKKLNPKETAEKICKLSKNTFKNWENGNVPSLDHLIELSKFLNVSIDLLLFGKDPSINIEHKLLNNAFDRLSPANKKMAFGLLNAIYDVQAENEELSKPKTIQIPFSLHKVSAGKGYDLNNKDDFEEKNVLETHESIKADFAIEVDGNSMHPTFSDGDIVLIQSCQSIDIGEVGIFAVNGKGFIKERGDGCLISHNPDPEFAPIIIHEGDEHKCWGKVIGKAELV